MNSLYSKIPHNSLRRPVLTLYLAVYLAVLSGCAVSPAQLESESVRQCRGLFQQTDAQLLAAGAGDPGLYAVPGFPYLRINRFLSSFRGEVDDEARFMAWVREMRLVDHRARASAISQLPDRTQQLQVQQALDDCAEKLIVQDFAGQGQDQHLREAAQLPSDYSLAQRLFGLYPLATPFLKAGINSYRDDVRRDYVQALRPPVQGRLMLWQAPETRLNRVRPKELAAWLARAQKYPLGMPKFTESELQRLFATYAPAWWVETASSADVPGSPALLGFDQANPRTYVLQDLTRFGGKVLPQLVYMIWFPQRPASSALDAYAGTLDGVIWRVTLGEDGRPLVYDTIHACGCYHYVFPARELKTKAAENYWNELPLLPQQGAVGEGPLVVRLAAGTHYVRRVLPQGKEIQGEAARYSLAPYAQLMALSDSHNQLRSLFDAQSGLVAGTERGERWWLWPSGIRSPGAMRAWGRHATAFVGQAHFDDADWLTQLFEAPAP